jgi:hypothetical protein
MTSSQVKRFNEPATRAEESSPGRKPGDPGPKRSEPRRGDRNCGADDVDSRIFCRPLRGLEDLFLHVSPRAHAQGLHSAASRWLVERFS